MHAAPQRQCFPEDKRNWRLCAWNNCFQLLIHWEGKVHFLPCLKQRLCCAYCMPFLLCCCWACTGVAFPRSVRRSPSTRKKRQRATSQHNTITPGSSGGATHSRTNPTQTESWLTRSPIRICRGVSCWQGMLVRNRSLWNTTPEKRLQLATPPTRNCGWDMRQPH